MIKKVMLRFDPQQSMNPERKHVRDGLSTVLRTENNIWVSCDESTNIERLTRSDDGSFGGHRSFDLTNYLDLPDASNSEIDIEGMGMADNYLWIVGSHSLKRKKPRRHDTVKDQMKRLSKVKNDPNRYLLARIPILPDEASGDYVLHKECEHPEQPGRMLRAAQLHGDSDSSILTEVLKQDEHIAPFMHIPGKDNGFDVEGLTISGKRIFIGLRGPVLRGWAMILEIETEEDEKGMLHLKQLTNKRPYKKHFLHLRGKGIRELRVFKNDIYILAGPTMDLDGIIAIYRWPDALQNEEEAMVHNNELDRLAEVPHGRGEASGKDKAEGLAIFDEEHVLVVFDSPTDDRKEGENGVIADMMRVLK